MKYFKHEKITEHILRIIDFLGNCCYLVIGEDKACLLDTLDGFGDLKEYVECLTDKPLIVALSHGHLDHVAGAADFNVVYLPQEDRSLFNLHTQSDYRLSRYAQDPVTQDIPIKDFKTTYHGDILELSEDTLFDLGGISIQWVKVPGHTKGMMVPIVIEERVAVFGDACGVGTLLFGEDSTNVETYRESLKHLKTYETLYDRVLRNHGTFESPKEVIDNVLECCEIVLSGKEDFQEIETHGILFMVAQPIDEQGNRLDKKQGNLKFTRDKMLRNLT